MTRFLRTCAFVIIGVLISTAFTVLSKGTWYAHGIPCYLALWAVYSLVTDKQVKRPERDPLKDPLPGDVVRGIPSTQFWGKHFPIRCEAICGNLVAISSEQRPEPEWILKSNWCKPDAWTSGYEVLETAAEGKMLKIVRAV